MKQYWKQTTVALSAAALTACMLPCMTSAQTVPCPVLSRNCPAYAGNGQASSANDEHYFSFWFSNAPDYLAYDLSAASQEERSRVILAWYNATGQYDPSILNGGSTNGVPSAYTIEINDAPGGTYPEDGWQVVDTVTGNTLHSRQHVIDLNGTANWVRMSISEGDGKSGGSISLQMDIHSAPEGKLDSWIFFGDSITAGGMMNCYGSPFAELVHAIDSKYFPAQENGGIGGIFSTDGKNNIDRWLASFPGEYVSVAYGTNDAWGNQTGAEKYYENTVYMMEAILASGKTPVLQFTVPSSDAEYLVLRTSNGSTETAAVLTGMAGEILRFADPEADLTVRNEYRILPRHKLLSERGELLTGKESAAVAYSPGGILDLFYSSEGAEVTPDIEFGGIQSLFG